MKKEIEQPSLYIYRGYVIQKTPHPVPLNPNRLSWDILDGVVIKKANISTVEVARHVIDTMLKYGYWQTK